MRPSAIPSGCVSSLTRKNQSSSQRSASVELLRERSARLGDAVVPVDHLLALRRDPRQVGLVRFRQRTGAQVAIDRHSTVLLAAKLVRDRGALSAIQ
ncbi:hypothetical protein [Brevibacterium picturae]|uniref:hypothetical protein n=1 Tax=Brevibacterium picturae TaxID=260553 RepID=UPI002653EDE1|nr:hypothetical protein [Brevibacterium aurantiacum]MDN5774697.1 hypothetical protein [Brevibacterium aurantiacum]